MKNIEPIVTWKNGQDKTASILDAYIINDNLSNSCTFYWMLKEASVTPEPTDENAEPAPIAGEILVDGNITMVGDDYDNWEGSNDSAFEFIADHLNLTII
jgi:hypothetical protein